MTNLSTRIIQRIEKEDKASLESINILASVFKIDIKELQEKIKKKIVILKLKKDKSIIF